MTTYLTISDLVGVRYNFRNNYNSTPSFKSFYETANKDYDETCFCANQEYLDIVLKRLINRWLNKDTILAVVYGDYDKNQVSEKFVNKILNKFQQTQDYYVEQIKRYEDFLTKDSKSYSNETTSETRFNDTPTAESDYSARQYTTNITSARQSVPVDRVDRYVQVRQLIDNIYNDWMNEFKIFEYYIGD